MTSSEHPSSSLRPGGTYGTHRIIRMVFLFAIAFVAMFLIGTLCASDDTGATSFEKDGIQYNTTSGSTVMVISNPNGYSGNVLIPSSVEYDSVTYSVTSIGSYSFDGCTSLVSVTIPNSVTTIEFNAFDGCTSLVSVTIPNGVTSIEDCAFSNCTSLVSVTIPGSVTYVGWDAFSYCTSLVSVTISNGVTSIGDNTFSSCSSLTSVIIPGSVTSIENGAFYNCISLREIAVSEDNTSYCSESGVLFNKAKTKLIHYPAGKGDASYTVPAGVTSIGWDAFYNCTSLVSVTIPNGVTSIEPYTFYSCTSLVSVTLPDSVTSIGMEAFRYCTSLVSATIPNGVTSIESGAFRYCTSLVSVTIPNSVTFIEGGAFYGCTSLVSVTIPNSVTSVEPYTFYGCTSLVSVTIPNSVTAIYYDTFFNCTSLASVTIPSSVTNIGSDAFYGCTSLREIVVSEDNTSYCSDSGVLFNKAKTQLKQYPAGKEDASYTVPAGVTSIEGGAFSNCRSLREIVVPEDNTSYCSDSGVLFNKAKTQLIQYPAGKEDASYTVPAGVTSIEGDAFRYCMSLREIVVPEDNTSYCSDSGVLFNKAKTQLIQYPAGKEDASYTVPDSVINVVHMDSRYLTVITLNDRAIYYNGILSGCSKLTEIRVNDSNPVYSAVNGVLLSKDKTVLKCMPAGLKEFTVPNTVARLAEGSIICSDVEKIILPANVSYMEWDSIASCNSLREIVIHNANIKFDDEAVLFTDGIHHKITVKATEGFRIPGTAVIGDVEFVYEPLNKEDDEAALIIGISVGAVAIAAAGILAFFAVRKKN